MMDSMFRNRPVINPEDFASPQQVQITNNQLIVAIIKVDQGKDEPRFAVMEGDNIIAVYKNYDELVSELPFILQLDVVNEVSVETL